MGLQVLELTPVPISILFAGSSGGPQPMMTCRRLHMAQCTGVPAGVGSNSATGFYKFIHFTQVPAINSSLCNPVA